MSDLISRSELLESFRKSYCGHLGMENSDGMMTFRSICRIINEQPTAYDIDKVVAELEKAKTINVDVGYGTIYKTIRKDVALEIVEQGNVSDDVCEWKKQIKTYDWQPSCETNSVYNVAGVGWFKVCPYCGKKIKVVE